MSYANSHRNDVIAMHVSTEEIRLRKEQLKIAEKVAFPSIFLCNQV